jgi:hypothetical protein
VCSYRADRRLAAGMTRLRIGEGRVWCQWRQVDELL